MGDDECPFCLGHMEAEDRDGSVWLVCPNGCATEYELPVRKLPALEIGFEEESEPVQVRAAGA